MDRYAIAPLCGRNRNRKGGFILYRDLHRKFQTTRIIQQKRIQLKHSLSIQHEIQSH